MVGEFEMHNRVYGLMWMAGAVALIGALFVGVSAAKDAPQGTVTPWDAMKTAVGKVPGGHALSATYALEEGHWTYDVIVVKGKTLTEVEIDAVTGKVGDAESVTPEGEGREMTAELNKAIGKPGKAAPEKGEKGDKD
jgi:hypothetical protein